MATLPFSDNFNAGTALSTSWLVETGGYRVPVPLTERDLRPVAVYPAGDLTVALYRR